MCVMSNFLWPHFKALPLEPGTVPGLLMLDLCRTRPELLTNQELKPRPLLSSKLWQKVPNFALCTKCPLLSALDMAPMASSDSLQTLYHTRKKSLVKRVFNFGSVRQDLDAANQIAEPCAYVTVTFKKRLRY